MAKKPFLVRGYIASVDLSFIKSSFLHSFRNSGGSKLMSNKLYFSTYSPRFEALLSAPGVITVVAVNPNDTSHIYGWSCWEKLGGAQILHYVYVKRPYWGFGIATEMLSSSGFELSEPFFYTLAAKPVNSLRRRFPGAVYNPWLFLKLK